MQIQSRKPKFTITRKKESLTVTIHGSLFDQHIGFNCYGGTHRTVFNNFANEIMKQKRLSPAAIYGIAKNYDRKHVNTMGISASKPSKNSLGCKIIF